MNRKEILQDIEKTLMTYCQGCFLKKHFRTEYGATHAHRFCISQCTVGEQLKLYGDRLNGK